jgi:hypothetical protein
MGEKLQDREDLASVEKIIEREWKERTSCVITRTLTEVDVSMKKWKGFNHYVPRIVIVKR